MFILLLLLPVVSATSHCHLTVTQHTLADLPDILPQTLATLTTTEDFHICFHQNDNNNINNIINNSPLQTKGKILHFHGSQHNHPHGGRVIWRPTRFTNNNSVTNNLTTETHSVTTTISGGSPLLHWYRCNDGVHCPGNDWNDVYVHYTSDIDNITKSFLPVRNLWVNGGRAARVSSDGDILGWNVTATGYSTPYNAVPTSFVTNQVELVWPRIIKNWIEPRCTISNISKNNIIVEPLCWKTLIARNGGKLPPIPTFVENMPIAPPRENEFFSTPKLIFYKPSSNMPYQPPINAYVPIQEQIMIGTNLTNHTFQHLHFAHTTWQLPSSSSGYVPDQTCVTDVSGEPRGAVEFITATELNIINTTFINIGSPYGLSVGGASQHVVITNNTFQDLSGGALKIGNVLNVKRALTKKESEKDIDYYIYNNNMNDIAVEYRGASTIFAGYVANTTISHNTIRDTGYTGISLGWGWGTHINGTQTFASDNHIIGNRMINVMSALNDGGCTYTLGPQPRSTVSKNYCVSDHAPVVGCFYHDNGSRYFTTTNNVCSTSPATPCVYLQGCCNAPALDIAVSNLWCRNTAPVRNGCVKERCTIDAKTLYMLKAGVKWPAAAQSIVDSAGMVL